MQGDEASAEQELEDSRPESVDVDGHQSEFQSAQSAFVNEEVEPDSAKCEEQLAASGDFYHKVPIKQGDSQFWTQDRDHQAQLRLSRHVSR